MTEFPDGTSLVVCYPKTGRTHQIRVHLQSLGFPIVNDFLYIDGKLTDDDGQVSSAR